MLGKHGCELTAPRTWRKYREHFNQLLDEDPVWKSLTWRTHLWLKVNSQVSSSRCSDFFCVPSCVHLMRWRVDLVMRFLYWMTAGSLLLRTEGINVLQVLWSWTEPMKVSAADNRWCYSGRCVRLLLKHRRKSSKVSGLSKSCCFKRGWFILTNIWITFKSRSSILIRYHKVRGQQEDIRLCGNGQRIGLVVNYKGRPSKIAGLSPSRVNILLVCKDVNLQELHIKPLCTLNSGVVIK